MINSSGRPVIRGASHAGSWYTANPSKLNDQLEQWLSAASSTHKSARAIISPHAGYNYSAPCAAFAFKQIDPTTVKRVFVLGPAHYLNLGKKCALSSADLFETPLYCLSIDKEIIKELYDTGKFSFLSHSRDEEEHSIEMQMPYVAKIMESRRDMFTVIPVLVGSLGPDQEAMYGQIFARYLTNPENVFVISSDFCHWGKRFQYTYYDKNKGAIWESIQSLDQMGMSIIERMSAPEFNSYIEQYANTICGRNPISILLQTIEAMRQKLSNINFELKFVKYVQSEHCNTMEDSSVSYAAAGLRMINN